MKFCRFFNLILVIGVWLSACQPVGDLPSNPVSSGESNIAPGEAPLATPHIPTAFPTRPLYSPGELVDYTAQTGDTLAVLAVRFNTSVDEILQANSFIPASASTMPPGMPMKIPIYYLPLWGSPYQILPDSHFINGPLQIGFDTEAFVTSQPGWLKDYSTYASGATRNGAEVVDLVAAKFSVSPRLLLALLEYQAGALSHPSVPAGLADYPLGYRASTHRGAYLQLVWAANLLNNGYYAYRKGSLTELEHHDGRIERVDPWQNAATVALMNYFNVVYDLTGYQQATGSEGFATVYRTLFGDPWQNDQTHLPGSLVQPPMSLPFEPGIAWAYTGGPHTGWGQGEPLAALDFAPPSVAGGCVDAGEWATAIADGLVARSETGELALDLDGDGDERTGWVIFYMHLATEGRALAGSQIRQGEPLGYPSCEGGSSTGTHIHIARKYNGEWIPAGGYMGILAFDLDGWIAVDGEAPYLGTLVRGNIAAIACTCSNQASLVYTEKP